MNLKLFVVCILFLSGSVTMAAEKTEVAYFAGGCFWCIEADIAKVPGVLDVVSGYTGGTTQKPSYEDVTSQATGHYEAIKVTFDPDQISYKDLLVKFWVNIDPFDDKGQLCDKGSSYRSAIFALDKEQEKIATESKAMIEKKLGKDVVTPILPASDFYDAEDYHQDYAEKNPIRYTYYRYSCGRDKRLKAIWAGLKD